MKVIRGTFRLSVVIALLVEAAPALGYPTQMDTDSWARTLSDRHGCRLSLRHPPQQACSRQFPPESRLLDGASEQDKKGPIVRYVWAKFALPFPIAVHQFFGRNVLRDDLEQNSFVDLNERARVEPSQASALIEELRTRVGDGIGHAYNDMESSSMFQSIISHTGRKHAVFGVQASHFVAFGEALDMGLAMAIWSRVYPRDVAGMDRAL